MNPLIKKSDWEGFNYVCLYGNQSCHAQTKEDAYSDLIVAVGCAVIGGYFEKEIDFKTTQEPLNVVCHGVVSNPSDLPTCDFVSVDIIDDKTFCNPLRFKISGYADMFTVVKFETELDNINIKFKPEINAHIPDKSTVQFYE